jgi:BirA family transcriptional regulator, biotin operon repressor / biotin---[acetyl-CoA-carboxylase] ligase
LRSDAEALAVQRYDGIASADLARNLSVPRLELFDEVASTQDVAHSLADAGAPAGTIVIADAQHSGRGRQGRSWQSPRGQGIWLTLIERPEDGPSLEVLSLRLGLLAAEALDDFAGVRVMLKWPNDLQLDGAKLAGILVEARWRDGRPDWVAIGFGLNVRAPKGVENAAALREGVRRTDVLAALVPKLRAAAARRGALNDDELAGYAARDVALRRRCLEPVQGIVRGIASTGELLVETSVGISRVRAGSLVFAEESC